MHSLAIKAKEGTNRGGLGGTEKRRSKIGAQNRRKSRREKNREGERRGEQGRRTKKTRGRQITKTQRERQKPKKEERSFGLPFRTSTKENMEEQRREREEK